MRHALVVDDERETAETLATLIADAGFSVATARTLGDARRQLVLHKPDLLMLDLMLPDGNGFTLLEDESVDGQTEVVLMTDHGNVESSVRALRLGAADYLVKPFDVRRLNDVLTRIGGRRPAPGDEAPGARGLLGTSPAMRAVIERIERAAPTQVTVLLTGESGSGKELAAHAVHERSRRRDRPMLAVNCGAISPHLIESELFGHEKGSFTGAGTQHIGLFERARGGTLFLDEITEMPLDLQVKLLRVLETGTFMRVGSGHTQTTDVRLIAATNRDPMQAVREGRLREDLLYRLDVFPIHMPALRERPEDIVPIAEHFLAAIGRREQRRKRFAPHVLDALTDYTWPGNVRELRNVVERAYVMAAGGRISDPCLPARPEAPSVPQISPYPVVSVCVGSSWAEIERQVVLATLEHFDGHQQRASDALGVSVKTLYNRLRDWSMLPHAVARGRRMEAAAGAAGRVSAG